MEENFADILDELEFLATFLLRDDSYDWESLEAVVDREGESTC